MAPPASAKASPKLPRASGVVPFLRFLTALEIDGVSVTLPAASMVAWYFTMPRAWPRGGPSVGWVRTDSAAQMRAG